MSSNYETALALLIAACIVGLLALMSGFLIIVMAWSEYDRQDREPAESAEPRLSGGTLVRRAIARRCPRCGRGALFRGYMTMNQACPACGAEFWQNAGEWMGPVVMDYSVAAGGALVTWSIMVLLSAPEFFQIIVPALVAAAGGAAVVPWSRSFWTLFLFVNGEMGLASKPAKTARLKPLAKKVLEFGRRGGDGSGSRCD
jgi:uncharacterized protein (DUF983 family)